ncbi:hypothetical protein AWZ03_014782 [Drosophila navojoa]|uniref:Uncharacterized protein n=1 Tax=Drosophila navojoa TaxID=7232 RepID=A0A484AQQ2_DRONA|nr:hypothetical protein AWZ03_014782 [Drosophila navojoa]
MDNAGINNLGDRSNLGIGRVHPADPRLRTSDSTGVEQVRLKKVRVHIKRLPLQAENGLQQHHSEEAATTACDSWSPVSPSSDCVSNGRYSPTRSPWRPPRAPTPYRVKLDSSEDEVMELCDSEPDGEREGSDAEGDVIMCD